MCQAACEEHFADAAVGMANKIDASFCSSRILAMLLREFVLIMLQIALGKHSPQTLSAAASRPVAVTVLHYCISMMQYGVHNVDLSKNSERVILSNLGSIYQSIGHRDICYPKGCQKDCSLHRSSQMLSSSPCLNLARPTASFIR